MTPGQVQTMEHCIPEIAPYEIMSDSHRGSALFERDEQGRLARIELSAALETLPGSSGGTIGIGEAR